MCFKRGYVLGTSNKRFISARGIAVYFLIFALLINIFMGYNALVFADSKGSVNYADGLNIRSDAGTDKPIVASIPYRAGVTIVDEKTAKDGSKWYKITSDYGNGYVFAEYITVNQSTGESSNGYDTEYASSEDFEAYLTSQGFPESYKPALRELHAAYPNWRFVAMHTGLDWSEVIYRETHPVSVSLVPSTWTESWKSTERAAFDTATGEYIIFDSGGYVAASTAAVEYYMDPRNNMGTSTVFQFLSNKFDASTQTVDGVKNIVAGSYLESRTPGGKYKTYADLIYAVGKKCGVNPMTIASMLIVEQGRSGGSDIISGKSPGYEGYYNFFNIGAYAANGNSAVTNGLIYAKNKGWDSPYKAILGGASIYADNYVYNNKSTIYFQKFNVLNGLSRVGTGQYMTAIYAAATEGKVMAEGYAALAGGGITFEIPVYDGMPTYPCPMPGSGDNIAYLTALSVKGYKLSPKFDTYTTSYTIKVEEDVNTIKINATPFSGSATVSGTGKVKIKSGKTKVEVTCTSSTGNTQVYTINIKRIKPAAEEPAEEATTETPEDTENQEATEETVLTSDKYAIGKTITGVAAKTNVSDFKSAFNVKNGSIEVLTADGKSLDGFIGTGCVVKLYDKSGTEKASYAVLIKGDNNGDGKVNSADALRTQRHSIGTLTLKGAQLAASDLNNDGKYNSADALLMQRYAIGTYDIKW